MPEWTTQDQWVLFRVGEAFYAQAISAVKEVIPYTPPTPVPGAPIEVEGVVNVRGEVITILSGHALLDAERTERQSLRVLVIDTAQERLGVVVDAIEGITRLAPDQIESVDSTDGLARATANHQGRLLILLELERGCDR